MTDQKDSDRRIRGYGSGKADVVISVDDVVDEAEQLVLKFGIRQMEKLMDLLVLPELEVQ